MQTDRLHDPVHDKGRPGHVSSVFQHSDTEKQKQYVRQKGNDASNAANDSVNKQ